MFWLKERASVVPPLVFDSVRQYRAPPNPGGKGPDEDASARESDNSNETDEPPQGTSGVQRKGKSMGKKRSRASSGLGDFLRANNDATNKTLQAHEERRNVRHKETIALREK
jgi:hypothetical protein